MLILILHEMLRLHERQLTKELCEAISDHLSLWIIGNDQASLRPLRGCIDNNLSISYIIQDVIQKGIYRKMCRMCSLSLCTSNGLRSLRDIKCPLVVACKLNSQELSLQKSHIQRVVKKHQRIPGINSSWLLTLNQAFNFFSDLRQHRIETAFHELSC